MAKQYKVRVLVGDGKPGLIPYTWVLEADNRDQAISIVRHRVRTRDKVVKHVDFARQTEPVRTF